MTDSKIKVLIVEDSLVNQNLLKGLVAGDSRFEVVAIANNGLQAIEYTAMHTPDVVSMDIYMPVMDGIEATAKIMQNNPVPIVIVSSFYQPSEVEMAINVLEAGAVTILPKPFGPGHPKFNQSARQYLNMLNAMSQVKVVRRKNKLQPGSIPILSKTTKYVPFDQSEGMFKIMVMGASAGGPEGIRTILSCIPDDFGLPVLVVQHIDSNFAEGFCAWLNTFSNLPVHIGKDGNSFLPGNVYLPPGNKHLFVKSDGIIGVSDDIPIKGHRPSVSTLFKSAAEIYGKKAIAVLLSGMGKDGAAELKILRDMGAYTLIQNEQSCLVYGMPGEAAKIGAACKMLSPDEIISDIIQIIKK